MEPTWGPSGADRTQVGPMMAPWTLLSGVYTVDRKRPRCLMASWAWPTLLMSRDPKLNTCISNWFVDNTSSTCDVNGIMLCGQVGQEYRVVLNVNFRLGCNYNILKWRWFNMMCADRCHLSLSFLRYRLGHGCGIVRMCPSSVSCCDTWRSITVTS